MLSGIRLLYPKPDQSHIQLAQHSYIENWPLMLTVYWLGCEEQKHPRA